MGRATLGSRHPASGVTGAALLSVARVTTSDRPAGPSADQHRLAGQLRAIALRNASRSGHATAVRTRPFSCFPSTTNLISSAKSRGTSPNRASRTVTMSWCAVSQAVSRVASRAASRVLSVSSSPYFSKPGKKGSRNEWHCRLWRSSLRQGAAYDSVPQFAVVGRGAGAANAGPVADS